MPSQLHQIRRGHGPTVSGILPTYALEVGTPLGVKTVNTNGEHLFGLANGAVAYGTLIDLIGHQTRDSRTYPGNNDTEIAFTFGVETPFLAGADGSVEPGYEVDVEGPTYVLCAATTLYPDGTSAATDAANGAIALTQTTAAMTELTFRNGLFSIALSTDMVTHHLLGVRTPVTTGNVRIDALRVGTYRKP